jgi:hydrogenase maturation protease
LPGLIIGYGNDLRGDDAVGQWVARAVAAWALPGVRSLAVHQLTPELAEALAEVDWAIFVDAYPSDTEGEVQVCPLALGDVPVRAGHTSDPRSLLSLAHLVYGTVPQAWWVLVPGINFELGEHLSPVAQQGMEIGLCRVKELVKLTMT